MTIKQYLYKRERLDNRRKCAFEKYMRLSARTSSTRSSLDLDGMPHSKGGNSREELLIESAAALEEYYKAADDFTQFDKEFHDTLEMLPLGDRYLLNTIYYVNQGRPQNERYLNVYKWTGLKKAEIPAKEKEAEAHLIEILRKQGVEIED